MENLINSEYLTNTFFLCPYLLNQKYLGYCRVIEYLYEVIPPATPLLRLQSSLPHSNQLWNCEAIIKTSDEEQ